MAQQNHIFPIEIRDVDPEINASLAEHYEDDVDYILVGPKGYFLHKLYKKYAATIYNLQPRADQVFVAGMPRSGTNWTQQLVWLICNDLDYDACESSTIDDKFAYLERPIIINKDRILDCSKNIENEEMRIKFINYYTLPIYENIQNYTYIKTHLPLSLLPPKLLDASKVVYVARDPRDVIVSLYFLAAGALSFKEDFKTMWKRFIQGTMIYGPYFENVKEAWEKRNHHNLLFLFYEDIQHDQLNTLQRVADFFGKSYTDDQLLTLGSYLHFDNLKNKKSFNKSFLKDVGILKPDAEPFLRKGKVGGWREYFDEEMSREAEQWIADNLRGTDLRFPTFTTK